MAEREDPTLVSAVVQRPSPPRRRVRHRRPPGEPPAEYMAVWLRESSITTIGVPLDRVGPIAQSVRADRS